MATDLDIWRAANVLIERYGDQMWRDVVELMDAVDAGMAMSIVAFPFVGIAQDLVRFRSFLELLYSGFVVAVAVWMKFDRQLAVCAVDLHLCGGSLDLQHFVVAGFFSH